ncbi:polysaccharide biosynthesis C-terminal domain-containing protein [Treponema socranskii]|uniref:polysaccharide biosynthesis C-terminal domain-containing protein n=1 Tax=Treponema socranskii TaxID=53419 RepID=UPI003D6E4466
MLIPKYGAKGAAVGTVIAETCITFFEFFSVRKMFKNKKNFICLIQVLFSTALMSCIIFYIINFFTNSIMQIVSAVISGALIYSILLFLTKNKTFIDFFKSVKLKYKKEL